MKFYKNGKLKDQKIIDALTQATKDCLENNLIKLTFYGDGGLHPD